MLLAASSLFALSAPSSWTAVADMPFKRMSATMANIGDGRTAYVGGTYFGSEPSVAADRGHSLGKPPFASGVVFDSAKGEWNAIPDMLEPRDSPGSCVLSTEGGSTALAVFGGTTSVSTSGVMNITDSTEVIQIGPGPSAWQYGPKLPTSRTAPSVTTLGGGEQCVVAGGFHGDSVSFQYLTDAYLFDGVEYTKLPDMPYGRSNMAIAAANNGIYILGGSALNPAYANVSYLQLVPTVGKAWQPMAPLHKARSWAMTTVLLDPKSGEELIVAAGGMSLDPMFQPMASVEVYNTKSDTWTLLDDGEAGALPHPIGFGSGARINSTDMMAGGGVGNGTTGLEAYTFGIGTHA